MSSSPDKLSSNERQKEKKRTETNKKKGKKEREMVTGVIQGRGGRKEGLLTGS